jgi:hypothetical protein
MLIRELETVQIGSDHTAVMRKQKIPPVFDNYCISLIGKDRSLDLMIQDKKIVQLWCEKIRLLIELNKKPLLRTTTENSPDSPSRQNPEGDNELHDRDHSPECILLIWRYEILNNLPKYWNTLSRELNYDEEIYFANSKHKQAVTNHIEQDGGYFLHLSREEH